MPPARFCCSTSQRAASISKPNSRFTVLSVVSAAEGKSVVFISSEVEELPLVCDRILLLQHGTFSQEFHSPVNVDETMSAILSVH